MNFIENVFVSEIDDINTVVYSLKRNIPVFKVYIILIDENSKSVILSSFEYFKNDEYKNMYAAGICSGDPRGAGTAPKHPAFPGRAGSAGRHRL